MFTVTVSTGGIPVNIHPHPPKLLSYFQGDSVQTDRRTGKENIWGVLWAAPHRNGVGWVWGGVKVDSPGPDPMRTLPTFLSV